MIGDEGQEEKLVLTETHLHWIFAKNTQKTGNLLIEAKTHKKLNKSLPSIIELAFNRQLLL